MTEVVVRRAVRTDVVGIVELFAQVDELHRIALPWLLRRLDEPRPPELLESYIADSECAAFVASDGDGVSLLGVLLIKIRSAPRAPVFRPARVAEIDNLVVAQASRRRGIGKRLVREALLWASAAQANRTELGVYEFNEPARAFWESEGFTTLYRKMSRNAGEQPG